MVEDLGSPDYSWYGPLTAQVLISGQTIRFTGMKALDCPFSLRRSVYRDPATQKCYGFLINPFKLSAKTIAAS